MPIIQSCCCCRSLRKGCYAASIYTLGYFIITVVTMGHFIDVEQRYLSGDMLEPESESFLEPSKITPITVALNITLLGCSLLGIVGCVLLIFGVYKDLKFMLLPWIFAMALETFVEIINLGYLGYLQTNREDEEQQDQDAKGVPPILNDSVLMNFSSTQEVDMNFNPITSFLFTLDFFIISLNLYALVCVISQFQEYLQGRGTAAFDYDDRLAAVQYTATAQQTLTTSSAMSGRRKSSRPMPSRHDPEEFSEAPSMAVPPSVLSKPSRSNIKKHVQFPDEQSCIVEDPEAPPSCTEDDEKSESRVISSLWMELETEVPPPDR